jgi:lipopolysaccharide/colanic/teichoic acid biosynthesis glycosyltransferase
LRSPGRLVRPSLDGLPGDLSLVASSFATTTDRLWHGGRVEVAPGRPWHVDGRSESRIDERLRFDLEANPHRSVGSDIRIMAATVGSVVHRSDA